MKRLRILAVAVSLLMMSTFIFLSISATTPANIDPGDTFTYTVSTWDVPWAELIPPEEAPFDLADFVFNLSGSTLGVKVMDTYPNGYYMLDFYVVLGKTIEIPLPDDADPQLLDIFGTSFTLDEGVGIGFGSLPGSDMTELIAGTEDAFGLPFYINPAEWSTYQTEFEALGSADATVTVTNTAGFDFEFSITGTTPEGVDIVLTAAWFREGDNAGVFKSITGTVDGDLTDDGVTNSQHLGIALSFEKKEVNLLPIEVRNLDDMILSLTTAQMTYSVTGLSTTVNAEVSAQLAAAEAFITAFEGLDVIKFDVEEVLGCYYKTRIEAYNPDSDMLEEVVEELWWNGFTGYPVTDYDDFFMSELPYTQWSPTIALIPLFAPGITPDWDMWAASTLSISQVNEIVEKALESFFKEEEVKDLGLDLNKYDSVYQLRESGTTRFFYSETALDLDWNAGQAEGTIEGVKSTTKLSIDFSSNNWLAYTTAGLLAGAGFELSAKISATDIPAEAGSFETGSISLDVNLALQSDQVSSIPDPEAADPIAGDDADDGGLIPGFEFISSLMVMTTAVVILKRKKRR